MIAHHGRGWSAGRVVFRRECTPRKGPDAEHFEIVPGDEFPFMRLGGAGIAVAANAQIRQMGRKGSQVAKFRRGVAKVLVKGIRIQHKATAVLGANHYTAIIVVAEAVELRTVLYGQRLEHHSINECEDRRVGANS